MKKIKQVANKTQTPPKKRKNDVEESVKEDEVAIKKNVGKKIPTKIQKKVVEEPSDDESDEVENNEDGIDMDDSEEEADEQMVDDDNESEEMEDSDEEEEMDDDDEEPSDSTKEEPTIPSQVKSGPISETVPLSKIVLAKNLPKQCKQIDIVEVFAKYGAIDQIHLQTNPFGTVANVAFKTENAAKSALAANKTVKVRGSLISVTKQIPNKRETPDLKAESTKVKSTIKDNCSRTVYVCRLKKDTTEDLLKEHFVSCGEIDHVNLQNLQSAKMISYAFVTFRDVSSKANAIKLHNTILNGVTIGVYENCKESKNLRDRNRTVIIKNKQHFKCIEAHKLEDIFSKCGEIEHLDIYCKNKLLAILTFKTNEAAEEALKLCGKTIQGIELELHKTQEANKNTTIHVSNLAKSVIEEDLRELFSVAGEIICIHLKPGYAVINFKDSESFCKSFLLNESLIKNQKIFIQPFSSNKLERKRSMKEKRQGFKRPGQNGKFSSFTAKRFRNAYQ